MVINIVYESLEMFSWWLSTERICLNYSQFLFADQKVLLLKFLSISLLASAQKATDNKRSKQLWLI